MTDKSQNNFENNNGLIALASSCAIRSDVSLELNVLPVKKLVLYPKVQRVFDFK